MLIWLLLWLAGLPAQQAKPQSPDGSQPGQVVATISAIEEQDTSGFSRPEAVEEEDEKEKEEEDEGQERYAQTPTVCRPVSESSLVALITVEGPLRLSRLPRLRDRCRSPCRPR